MTAKSRARLYLAGLIALLFGATVLLEYLLARYGG